MKRVKRSNSKTRGRAATRYRRRGISLLLVALAFVGFCISLYLTFAHYRGVIPRCFVVQGCGSVQTSKYSAILGIPVALLGTIYFAVMFYLGIGLLTSPGVVLIRSHKVFSFLGAIAAIPLFLIQAVVLKAYCSYCLVAEAMMLALWVVSFFIALPEAPVGAVEGTLQPGTPAGRVKKANAKR